MRLSSSFCFIYPEDRQAVLLLALKWFILLVPNRFWELVGTFYWLNGRKPAGEVCVIVINQIVNIPSLTVKL